MSTVLAYKIVDAPDCPTTESARLQHDIPSDVPYLGLWRRPHTHFLIHLFSKSPPEIFKGWGWTREPD
jgi:hypothetical protein